MGGTEATVVRVAEGLGSTHRVLIAQHNRPKEDSVRFNAVYAGMQVLDEVKAPDAVVVMRSFEWLVEARRRFPESRLFLWVTDWKEREPGINQPLMMSRRTHFRWALTGTKTTLVAVSSAHLEVLRSWARPNRLERLHRAMPDSTFVYNPVDDALTSESREWDRNKLIYFSRPDQRLDQVLRAFVYVREQIKDLRLLIGNPGYLRRKLPELPGVEPLGVLPHAVVLTHVQTSLCAFYPNTRVPEAFGLVFAESNAVGTPVLTHRMGAAPEILSEEQLVDSANLEQVAQRIRTWWDGRRPVVKLNPRFRLSSVLADWNRLLGWSSGPDSPTIANKA